MNWQSPNKTRKPSRTMRSLWILFAAVSLAGCATSSLPASVAGGECKIIPRAEYEVVGKTQYDQDFADATVVAGQSCGYPLPKPRPPSFDEPSRGSAVPTAQLPAPRKPSLWQRTKAKAKGIVSRVRRNAPGVVTPAVASPQPIPVPAEPEADPPPKPKPPCIGADRLLHRCTD